MDNLRALRKKKVKKHRMSVTSHDVLAHLPTKEGLLKKKSAAGLWQERFFVVNNRYLNYYTVESRELLGTVNLAAIDEIEDPVGGSTSFRLTTSASTKGGNKSDYKLKASGHDEALEWVNTLRVRKQGLDVHSECGIQVLSKDKDEATSMIDEFLAAAPRDRKAVAERRYKDAFQPSVASQDLPGLLLAAASALAQLCALLTEHTGSAGMVRTPPSPSSPSPPLPSSAPSSSPSSSSSDPRRPSALPRDLDGARDLVRRMSRCTD
jgi:hypothetical protein